MRAEHIRGGLAERTLLNENVQHRETISLIQNINSTRTGHSETTTLHPVPMLSIQSPSYAGMERLGVPVRTTINNGTDDRRRLCMDATVLVSDRSHRHHHHNHHHHHHGSAEKHQQQPQSLTFSINQNHHPNCANVADTVRHCPHHVSLPDSEKGSDSDKQYQAELTRSFIKPPPNKTAFDIPDHLQTHAFNPYVIAGHTQYFGSAHLPSNFSPTSANPTQPSSLVATPAAASGKSKPNPITKFLKMRFSSTKTQTAASSGTTTTLEVTRMAAATAPFSIGAISGHRQAKTPTSAIHHHPQLSSSSSVTSVSSVSLQKGSVSPSGSTDSGSMNSLNGAELELGDAPQVFSREPILDVPMDRNDCETATDRDASIPNDA